MTASLVLPGLLDGPGPELGDHLAAYGSLPPTTDAVQVAAGLSGRGGAGFPVAVKLRAVAAAARSARRAPVVVANGAEGEPSSAKDAVLLDLAPHLVLDGLQLVARTLGADAAVLAAPADRLPALTAHLAARRDPLPVRLHASAGTFLAGEESALVAAIDGFDPLPTSKIPPIRERGVAGRPTLVQNVETLARLALLARGAVDAAERVLVTRRVDVGGAALVDVADVDVGLRVGEILRLEDDVAAVLVGGYHGTWLPAQVAREVPLDGLPGLGASLGAGVLAALPRDRCGLRETARVIGYLAAQSAGQCGPCLNGLPRIAAALDLLARPRPAPGGLLDDLHRWCGLVTGRGACRHPDGSVRLVGSALRVFAGELELHRAGRCGGRSNRPFLPVPGVLR